MTVRLTTPQGSESADRSFAEEVLGRSQAKLERCYQCQACSSGCPVAFAFDIAPHRLLRMVQFGLKDRVLDSQTVWLCASCETCATRCPNDIEIVHVMDTLRDIAIREGRTAQTKLPLFHDTFLDGIRRNGRIHELTLIIKYTFASGEIFHVKKLMKDALMGAKMFLKDKLILLPKKIDGVAGVRSIFQQTERRNRSQERDHGQD
jgi:heterodisulfide reductase subunit C